jgi:hypothetical protein
MLLPEHPEGNADACLHLLVRTYTAGAGVGTSPIIADPNGNCRPGNRCGDFSAMLSDMWIAWGQGVGTSPVWEPGSKVSQSHFAHLAHMIQAYVAFGFDGGAAPVGSFGAILEAAGMGLAPISWSANDEAGVVPLQ